VREVRLRQAAAAAARPTWRGGLAQQAVHAPAKGAVQVAVEVRRNVVPQQQLLQAAPRGGLVLVRRVALPAVRGRVGGAPPA
jgi:hypothetical protein